MSMTDVDPDAVGEPSAFAARTESTQTRLSDVVDRLDVLINPDKNNEDTPIQQELEQTENELHTLYARVTKLRRQLKLPPLTLTAETEPPTYQSVVSSTDDPGLAGNTTPFRTNLEWIDVLERGSDNWSNLTFRFSREVDEWDIVDFILFNGQKINKPEGGWGESCGPHVVYGTKRPTPIVIVLDEEWHTVEEPNASNELTGAIQREIRYSMIVDRSERGTKTIPRSFAIQRRQDR